MARQKVMVLIEEYSGLMRRRVCREEHEGTLLKSRLRGNGTRRYYFRRRDWQCANGCKLLEKPKEIASVVSITQAS